MGRKKVTYASLEMMRFIDRRGSRRVTGVINNLEERTVVTQSGYIDSLSSRLERIDPGGEIAYKIAGRYRHKSS